MRSMGWSRGGDLRIELTQSTGGGIAWVGERLPTLFHQPLVELLEGRLLHDDLTPQREKGWNRPLPIAKAERDRSDGLDVGDDALTTETVATSGRARQQAILIDQLHRGTVELGLEHVLDLCLGSQGPAHPLVEALDGLRRGIGIEAEHGGRMLDGGKGVQRLTTDPLCGRVRSEEVRETFLQPP